MLVLRSLCYRMPESRRYFVQLAGATKRVMERQGNWKSHERYQIKQELPTGVISLDFESYQEHVARPEILRSTRHDPGDIIPPNLD